MAFLIGSGIIFVTLSALFIACVPAERRAARWLGPLVLLLSIPVSYWFGAFRSSFEDGICYSESIGHIADAVETANDPRMLAAAIRALPLEGYETVCKEVRVAASKLPAVSRSNPSLERP